MHETYQYTFLSVPFRYEIGADELIIRSAKKERRVAWTAITKAVYLAPIKQPTFPDFHRPLRMLRALPMILVLDEVHDQGTIMILSGDGSKIDKVFLHEADHEAGLFFAALKERLQPVWQEASTQGEAYRLLGVPPAVERLFWLPQVVFVFFVLSLIFISLISSMSSIFLYLGVLACMGALFSAAWLIIDIFSLQKLKRAMKSKSSSN